MPSLTVTLKGQVTLRKDILRHLGIAAGAKIDVEKLPGGRVALNAARQTGEISDIFGIFKRADQPSLSIEEINRIGADGWAGKRD